MDDLVALVLGDLADPWNGRDRVDSVRVARYFRRQGATMRPGEGVHAIEGLVHFIAQFGRAVLWVVDYDVVACQGIRFVRHTDDDQAASDSTIEITRFRSLLDSGHQRPMTVVIDVGIADAELASSTDARKVADRVASSLAGPNRVVLVACSVRNREDTLGVGGSSGSVAPGPTRQLIHDAESGRLHADREDAVTVADLSAYVDTVKRELSISWSINTVGSADAEVAWWTPDRPRDGTTAYSTASVPGGASASDALAPDDVTATTPFDDDVQFTIFRPQRIQPARWHPLLAFAHKTTLLVNDDGSLTDPVDDVAAQAKAILAGTDAVSVTADSTVDLYRGSELLFEPWLEIGDVNPKLAWVDWQEPVHRIEFRLRVPPSTVGRRLAAGVRIFVGALLIGEVKFRLPVDHPSDAIMSAARPQRATRYNKIFASYSHRDTSVVEAVQRYVETTGDRYLIDAKTLRSGEVWQLRIAELIEQADVFQLFWSRNAMASQFVRREWEHALHLGRPDFIRPVYWEDPMAEDPARGLPPDDLRRLHFSRLRHPHAEQSDSLAQPDRVVVEAARRDSPPATHKTTRPLRRTRYPQFIAALLLIFTMSVAGIAVFSGGSSPPPSSASLERPPTEGRAPICDNLAMDVTDVEATTLLSGAQGAIATLVVRNTGHETITVFPSTLRLPSGLRRLPSSTLDSSSADVRSDAEGLDSGERREIAIVGEIDSLAALTSSGLSFEAKEGPGLAGPTEQCTLQFVAP